jgi:hypothetical protein
MLGPSTGVPLGLLETITIVYAVEVAPTCLRGFLTSYVSQIWVSSFVITLNAHRMTDNPQVIGQILSVVVGRSILRMEGPWVYRLPFAIQ